MSRSDEEYRRYELIYEMEHHYRQRAYSDSELGELLGTDRSNIWRIRRLMADKLHIPITEHPLQANKYYIHPDYAIHHIPFNREQMVALYLAGRRLQQQTRTSQHHVAVMLEKLARALRKPLAQSMVLAAQAVLAQEQDAQQSAVFATIVRCWLDNIPVRIIHRKLGGQPREYRVHPYQIEPSVWGDGEYLIGYSEYHGKLATFKMARIERAREGTGHYEIPTGFNVHELLNYAWGVWHADEEPVTVRLRFSKWVVPRVRETIWHPQAILHPPDADGSCVWEAPIAEWREMVPWVRGWGADVKVEAPEELRSRIEREVARLVKLYSVAELPKPPLYQLLWAKTSSDHLRTHPLICHLIDVAQVTLALWHYALEDGLRQQMATALGLPPHEAGQTIAFWAGLHDLGKATPAFQRKYDPVVEPLKAAGLPFARLIANDPCYHATLTTSTLPELLVACAATPVDVATEVAQALGGHHGVWPAKKEVLDLKDDQIGGGAWHQVRSELVQVLYDLLAPAQVAALPADARQRNAFLVLFSGLTSVADWIGSMETYFPYIDAPVDVEAYVKTAARAAQEALAELGWNQWHPPVDGQAFAEIFGFAPRAMQQEVTTLAGQLPAPSLVIIEAPTGSGKTEAALYLADVWARTFRQRGLYVAMPTMATSNQMHGRVAGFLRSRYQGLHITPLLVHSQARWQTEEPPPDLVITDEHPQRNASIADMSWFLPAKRSLLAPFAVGTVDQSLLSVLWTRHFFVRLFALGHKTIIFDEVHAYDTYMSTLFLDLLKWLAATGASVVLLSATLPAKARQAMLAAWTGDQDESLAPATYPAISWASAGQTGVIPLDATESRQLHLHWANRTAGEIVAILRRYLVHGGCAAVLCNTVARAQEVYLALAEADLVASPDDLLLFHARFPLGWRNEIEQRVLARFGKSAARTPGRTTIVVATQVIEQSLDLDFDLMISDLAPVDLLIQRAGRLHRHQRHDRPAGLAEPNLVILASQTPEELLDLEADVYIYEPWILHRTYLALQGRTSLVLPQETSPLIEQVYGDEPITAVASPAMMAALEKAQARMHRRHAQDQQEAEQRLVPPPDYKRLLVVRNPQLEEDDPAINQTLQARTRLGPPTVALVCLHETPAGLNSEPDGSGEMIDVHRRPDNTTTRQLANSTVAVNHQGIVQHLLRKMDKEHARPSSWNDHALLRNHFLLRFHQGVCHLDGCNYRLVLSKTYGLCIEKVE